MFGGLQAQIPISSLSNSFWIYVPDSYKAQDNTIMYIASLVACHTPVNLAFTSNSFGDTDYILTKGTMHMCHR